MRSAEEYRANAETAAVLLEAGVRMMRENIRRRFPAASSARIDALLNAWLHRTDDPIPGDTAGEVRIRTRAS